MKFDQGLKMGNNFACRCIATGDTVKQVAAMGQQTAALMWSCAFIEFD